MEFQREFENSLRQIISMLKALLSGQGPLEKEMRSSSFRSPEQPLQINVCFFNVFPPLDEDEWEGEDEGGVEEGNPESDKEEWNRLSPSDLEFLRKNGIQF